MLSRRSHRFLKCLFVEQIRDDGSLLGIGYGFGQSVAQRLAELRIDSDVRHRRSADDDLPVIVPLAVLDALPGLEFGHPGLDLFGLFLFFGDQLFGCLAATWHMCHLCSRYYHSLDAFATILYMSE